MIELKSETEDLWLLRYSGWAKWTGWIGLPLLICSSIYFLSMPFWVGSFQFPMILSSLFLGGLPLYMCMQCIKVVPYTKADIEFNDTGFSIFWPSGSSRKYRWSEVKKLKHSGSSQVLVLLSANGDTILAVTNMASSYAKFVEILGDKTGLTY